MKLIKTDHEGYMKDLESGAILSVDNAKLDAYKKQKKAFQDNSKTREKVDKLEKDMGDIKQLLGQILDKIK